MPTRKLVCIPESEPVRRRKNRRGESMRIRKPRQIDGSAGVRRIAALEMIECGSDQ